MELIRTYPNVVLETDGREFACASYSKQRGDGRWEGRIVFFPLHGGPAVATDRETTQPRRTSLEYWADGLSPTFLQGALSRALRRGPDATPDVPPPFQEEAAATDEAVPTDDPVHVKPPRGLSGARPMARLIERQIAAPLADSILFGPLRSGGVVRVEVQDGSLHVAVAPV